MIASPSSSPPTPSFLGRALVFRALAAGLKPQEQLSVAEWADAFRHVAAESGSPRPGRWSTTLVPYAREIMEALGFDHPCREVTFVKSAQVGGSEIGINLLGYVVDVQPSPILIVLPTIEEAQRYNRIKLQPAIEATPALRAKVKDVKSRDATGSTTAHKRFRGGFAQITGANASAGLQMVSVRVLIAEELSEWPAEAGDRGDPLEQAERRTLAWSDRAKRFNVSTPGLKGLCRITAKWEASDQRRYYVPCPHCGDFQALGWGQVKWKSAARPHGAHLICAAHGCVIEEHDRARMLAGGRWVPTWPTDDGVRPPPVLTPAEIERTIARGSGGREPGFHIWQAYSPFVALDDTVADWLDAEGNPEREKVFSQQDLGEAWEESGEAPDLEGLAKQRFDYPAGTLPPGALVLTGMVDVQADRLEWAVYGWGIGMTGWLIDHGIVPGDTATDAPWRDLDPVIGRTFPDANGRTWPVEAWGVDTGYNTHRAYQFCRARPRLFALKGDSQKGHLAPMFAFTPSHQDVRDKETRRRIGSVRLYLIGTHQLKSWVYAALRRTLDGPDKETGIYPQGGLRFHQGCDENFFEQLTSEYIEEIEGRDGRLRRIWRVRKGRRNEQLDLVVGARALAAQQRLDLWTRDKWAQEAAARGMPAELAQLELGRLWTPGPPRPSRPRGARGIR